MRAVRVHQFGGPEQLICEQMPDPVAGDGQILVAIKAAGVNPVDTYIRAGWYPVKPILPYIPGSDGAGVIVALGRGVSGFQVGQRVFVCGSVSGTYAEYAVCLPEQVFALPDWLTFEQGAAIGVPYATAWRALFEQGGLVSGKTVLVHGGSGGVGIAAIQLARQAGATVFATAGSEEGRRLTLQQGAAQAFDHNDPTHIQAVLNMTDGKGVDLIVEMLANANLDGDLDAAAVGATVVIVGSRGRVEIEPRKIMARNLTINAVSPKAPPKWPLKQIFSHILDQMYDGGFAPVVDRKYPLSDAAKSHQEIMDTKHCGKIVLVVE